jgi:hypothetical protein
MSNANALNLVSLIEKQDKLGIFFRPGEYIGNYYSLTLYQDGSLVYNLISDTPYEPLEDGFKKTIPLQNNNKEMNKNNNKTTVKDKLLKFLSDNISKGTFSSFSPFYLKKGYIKYAKKETKIYIKFNDTTTELAIYNVDKKSYIYTKCL